MDYQIIVFLLLLSAGYLIGRSVEKKHYKSIISREKELNSLPAVNRRFPPADKLYQQQLVMGNVVISSDYFKTFVAGLRNIFGGNVSAFETLLDRGRREALLRLKEQAQAQGAELVFNVRYETSNVAGRKMPSVEVLVYGTALIPEAPSDVV